VTTRCEVRAVLLKIDTVIALHRKTAEQIYDQVGGSALFENPLRWVFNVATNPHGRNRDLRFWTREIIAYETTTALTLDQVIDSLVPPTRTNWHSGQVIELLNIRWPTLGELREQLGGQSGRGTSFFARESLAAFLRQRVVAVNIPNQKRRAA
jgi:hypothetical protein